MWRQDIEGSALNIIAATLDTTRSKWRRQYNSATAKLLPYGQAEL